MIEKSCKICVKDKDCTLKSTYFFGFHDTKNCIWFTQKSICIGSICTNHSTCLIHDDAFCINYIMHSMCPTCSYFTKFRTCNILSNDFYPFTIIKNHKCKYKQILVLPKKKPLLGVSPEDWHEEKIFELIKGIFEYVTYELLRKRELLYKNNGNYKHIKEWCLELIKRIEDIEKLKGD